MSRETHGILQIQTIASGNWPGAMATRVRP